MFKTETAESGFHHVCFLYLKKAQCFVDIVSAHK